MLKLIKYEFIKKSKLLLILLISAILANIGLVLAYGTEVILIFLSVAPVILVVLYLFELIMTYSEDLNKKTGYMLFMTPNSGYKILGSKLITIFLEGILLLTSYFIFSVVNLSVMAYKKAGDFSFIGDAMREIVDAFNKLLSGTLGINIGDLGLIFILLLTVSIIFVLTVYTAITIRKSIFSNAKFGGVLSFVIFVILNIIYFQMSNLLGDIFNFNSITIQIGASVTVSHPSAYMFKIFTVLIIFNCITASILMLCSGYLIEKKINL